MDENTRMMIQLASMMMHNEKAIKEAQSQISTATVPTTPSDEPQELSVAGQTNGTSELTTAVVDNANASVGIGQPVVADLSKPLSRRSPNSIATLSSVKKQTPDKPATIAQLIQSQSLQNGQTTTAKLATDGKIFVYNKLPVGDMADGILKQEPSSVAVCSGNGLTANNKSLFPPFPRRREHGIGPVKNRYGRTLRPGIDNFGRFEAVANPGLIMHAMELLRQKDKKKRGPKEKETFSVFMYCLPDKNSKLPKFSSLDPIERALVDQHQREGYGYPAQDYINGIPRKTQLCLTFDDEKFHSFMLAIYPNLALRLYDMYRIDKTRRLIRVEVKSPRQLKDMKYQGSVIVIPYDSPEERPAPIIHRNFEDCYNNNNTISSSNNNSSISLATSLGNPLALMQNYTIPLPSLPEVVPGADDIPRILPVFPGLQQAMCLPSKHVESSVAAAIIAGRDDTRSQEQIAIQTYPEDISDDSTSPFDTIQILCRASELRSQLKHAKRIHIKAENLYMDILAAYRDDPVLETHKLNVCFQDHSFQGSPSQLHDDDVDAGSVLVMFWEEAMRKVFTGNQDVVPVIDPSVDSDVFQICGRILVHGLVLDNYLPLKLSPASLCQLLTDKCSEKTMLASFYRLISESEKEIIEKAAEEVKIGQDMVSPILCNSIKILFGSYGCKYVQLSNQLVSDMPKFAESILIRQPHWALQQMKRGVLTHGVELFLGTKEEELLLLYQILRPSVPSILKRISYIYSNTEEMQTSENTVKEQFEGYLMKLPKITLQRFLYQWSGYDCLCVTNLFVKFSGTDISGVPVMFCPRQALLCLPSASTSLDELRSFIEGMMPGLITDL